MKFFNSSLVLLILVFAGCSKKSSPASVPVTVVSLVADGVTNNAPTLQQAIINCSIAGGGIVEVPAPTTAGEYMISPVYMLSNVNLQIDAGATLLADPVHTDYNNGGNSPLNLIYNGTPTMQNVSITGGGTIDGNGQSWWAAYLADNSILRPRLIYITNCENLKVEGVTLQNSPSFHFVPYQCSNVIANNITILAPSTSPNTDGIDPSQCNNVTITNCTIDNGDDDIAIKAAGLCENITVKNCTFKHGHGLSIGSETYGNFSSLTVDSCTFNGTTNGIRLKSYTGDGGLMSNMSYSNITMQNVENPIVVNLNYSTPSGTGDIPRVNGLTIKNLTVTGSSNAGTLIGLSNSILQNITLSNVNISANSPMVISYANNVSITNSTINGTAVSPGSNNIVATNVNGRTGF